MKSKYLETISLIHTSYNLLERNINVYDYTFYNLCLILLRKKEFINYSQSSLELSDAVLKNVFSKRIFQRLKVLDQKIFNPNLIPFISDSLGLIYGIKDDVFKTYYKEITNQCISLLVERSSRNHKDSTQPKELTELMHSFLPDSKKFKIYNPFAGMCSIGLNINNYGNYYAEEINTDSAILAELRFLIFEKENFVIVNGDSIMSLSESNTLKYDFVISSPPFNLNWKSSAAKISFYQPKLSKLNFNAFVTRQSIAKLNDTGKAILTVPESLLYSKTKDNIELRKYLLSNNYLEVLIKLPNNFFHSTAISSYLIIISKEQHNHKEIKMVDASNMVSKQRNKQNILDVDQVLKSLKSDGRSEFLKYVSVNEIIENDYNLSVNRYFVEDLNLSEEETFHLEKLSNIVTIVKRERASEVKGKLIRIGDLSKDKLDYTKNFEDLEERDLKNSPNLLKQDSLLLSSIQTDLKPTVFIKTDSKIYYPPNFIMACIVDSSKVDLDYLVLELHKDYVINQIKAKRIGTAIQRITRKDLLEIEIVLPNMAEQLKKVDLYRSSIIIKKQEDFKKLVKSYGIDVADENSFLRHQIAGTLKNARGSFKAIKQIIYEQIVPKLPGTLDIKRNELLETTLFDYINVLERDILNITNAVNVVGKEYELKSINLQKLEVIQFLKNYVDEVKNRENNIFEVSLNVDDELLSEEKVDKLYINGDEKFLRRVFNNIIDNAEKHGFNNQNEPTNKIEIDFLYDFDNSELQIDFGNSGFPLPENYSHEEFIRKGSKKGDNSGEGIGGWYMNEVMKLHNGRFGFTDETGPEGVGGDMVTTIELTFPLEINV
tara:strand:- start:12985 stop:15471 length:2487 start_codon:yes stop_codon:yes gene_type:complete